MLDGFQLSGHGRSSSGANDTGADPNPGLRAVFDKLEMCTILRGACRFALSGSVESVETGIKRY